MMEEAVYLVTSSASFLCMIKIRQICVEETPAKGLNN
jgi:hypothetical protein